MTSSEFLLVFTTPISQPTDKSESKVGRDRNGLAPTYQWVIHGHLHGPLSSMYPVLFPTMGNHKTSSKKTKEEAKEDKKKALDEYYLANVDYYEIMDQYGEKVTHTPSREYQGVKRRINKTLTALRRARISGAATADEVLNDIDPMIKNLDELEEKMAEKERAQKKGEKRVKDYMHKEEMRNLKKEFKKTKLPRSVQEDPAEYDDYSYATASGASGASAPYGYQYNQYYSYGDPNYTASAGGSSGSASYSDQYGQDYSYNDPNYDPSAGGSSGP
ncbi:hypothetical protein F4778DRAFT_266384 [Xylariomycetidae sp. FL2044]|nr:hypothetical protein F4778DRAFT_266384 [Xylariomycetidae sp. FL2044]